MTRGESHTAAATDDAAGSADDQQRALNEGPSVDSIRDQVTVVSSRLGADRRWRAWGPWVSQNLGINSLVCLQLFTSEQSYASLSLYSDQPDAFDAHDEAVALALAAHAAVAIANDNEIEGLTTAVGSHTVIGRAEGILMERFGLDADQAFAVLVRMSQSENRRLVLIAEELIKTRPSRTNRPLPG